jgi:serine/threonine protein kinase
MAEDEPMPDRVGKYKLMGIIGSGAFATVYKAQHQVTMSVVALKAIAKRKVRSQAEFELLQREVMLMKVMDHPFVAPLFEVLDDEVNFYLAIELVENGNLLDYINRQHGLSEEGARRIYFQLVSVLDYLHREKHIVHRDLKAENVLLDQYSNIRVVDFGLSKNFSKQNPFLQTTCGSPAYVSPEIIREEPYTTAADVWASGVLLYAMVCGSLPFDGDNLSAMLQAILSASPIIPGTISPELRSLLNGLLLKDSKARITIRQIFDHSWLHDMARVNISELSRMKVQEVEELDSGVLNELRLLGYDTGSLLQELKNYVFNERTAAYRMLRRRQIVDEIHALWTRLAKPRPPEALSQMVSQDKLPALEPEGTRPPKKSEPATTSQGLPKLGGAPKPRKRISMVRTEVTPTVPLAST